MLSLTLGSCVEGWFLEAQNQRSGWIKPKNTDHWNFQLKQNWSSPNLMPRVRRPVIPSLLVPTTGAGICCSAQFSGKIPNGSQTRWGCPDNYQYFPHCSFTSECLHQYFSSCGLTADNCTTKWLCDVPGGQRSLANYRWNLKSHLQSSPEDERPAPTVLPKPFSHLDSFSFRHVCFRFVQRKSSFRRLHRGGYVSACRLVRSFVTISTKLGGSTVVLRFQLGGGMYFWVPPHFKISLEDSVTLLVQQIWSVQYEEDVR